MNPEDELKARFPDAFAAWQAAGGIRDGFKAFLLGQGLLPATNDDFKFMFGQMLAKGQEVQGMMGHN